MYQPSDAAARESALNGLYTSLVDLETTITNAEQRNERMSSAIPMNVDRFSALGGNR